MATLVFSHFPSLQLPKQFSVLACPNATRIGLSSTQHHLFSRKSLTYLPSISAVLSGTEDIRVSSTQYEDLCITVTTGTNGGEIKISVEVSGAKTQAIFDDVFDKMVAAAQPIPGFRRVKGGKTPNIPRDVLVEVLGPSKVYKQVIKKVINSTIAEYVEKEGLEVKKDLRVEQSFEDLEAAFEPAGISEAGFSRGRELHQGKERETDKLLRKFRIMLLSVNNVYDDAEDKQLTNSAVRECLGDLKEAILDAEDLLDKIKTEALRRKLEADGSGNSTSTKVHQFLSYLFHAFD